MREGTSRRLRSSDQHDIVVRRLGRMRWALRLADLLEKRYGEPDFGKEAKDQVENKRRWGQDDKQKMGTRKSHRAPAWDKTRAMGPAVHRRAGAVGLSGPSSFSRPTWNKAFSRSRRLQLLPRLTLWLVVHKDSRKHSAGHGRPDGDHEVCGGRR